MEKLSNLIAPSTRHLRIVERADNIAVKAYQCDVCKDVGYVRRDVPYGHVDFGKGLACTCLKEKLKAEKQHELISSSGVLGLSRYKDATLENFDTKVAGTHKAHFQATSYARGPEGWLVLIGPYGCGKTHLAVAIAKERILARDTVLVQTVPDLLDYLRSSYHSGSDQSYDARFEEMKNADLLVLDDYGAQSDTKWADEKMFQLVNHRYNAAMKTVITLNSEALASIDRRIYSRMHDQALVRMVNMDQAKDYRMYGSK